MVEINPEIIRRRVKIDFAAANASGWSGRNTGLDDVLNALSFVFPAGEAYFINSVRYYLGRITDPVLKEQAERFIYQEAMHSKEHARSNQVLKQIHPYGREMERMADALLGFGRRFTPKATQLATSCALEHFTAMLADVLLRDQRRLIDESEPAFVALWLWHAVEETEHKAVCFDVYQHIFGRGVLSYLHRVFIMATTSLTFVAVMAVGFGMIKWKKRRQHGRSDLRSAGMPRLGVMLGSVTLKMYLDYYRFSFHPWQQNNAHLIDEWKAHYANFGAGLDDTAK
jgi:hypothetical protein